MFLPSPMTATASLVAVALISVSCLWALWPGVRAQGGVWSWVLSYGTSALCCSVIRNQQQYLAQRNLKDSCHIMASGGCPHALLAWLASSSCTPVT